MAFDPSKPSSLFRSTRLPTPLFSAGGILFRVANTPAVTIVAHITAFPADRAMKSDTSWYGVAPGDTADGTVTPLTFATANGLADYQGSFRLGPDKGALGPGPRARFIHVYRGLAGTGYNWIRYDTWALPQVSGVEFDSATGKLTWPPSPVEGLIDRTKRDLFDEYEVVARRKDRPDDWAVLDTVAGGKDSYELVIDQARLTREGVGPDVCVRVRDVEGNTSPEGCPEGEGELVFRLTSLTSTGDPLAVGNLFGAFVKPTPSPVSACIADPASCYFAVLPVPGTSGGAGAVVPWICTADGLKTVQVTPADTLLNGTCFYLGGRDLPSEKGIPAMYTTLTATSLKSELGGTDRAGPDSQPNVTNWVVLDASFTRDGVTGTIQLTDYFEFESDGVWTPDYNENGPLPNNPPIFATVTFAGDRVN